MKDFYVALINLRNAVVETFLSRETMDRLGITPFVPFSDRLVFLGVELSLARKVQRAVETRGGGDDTERAMTQVAVQGRIFIEDLRTIAEDCPGIIRDYHFMRLTILHSVISSKDFFLIITKDVPDED